MNYINGINVLTYYKHIENLCAYVKPTDILVAV